MWVWKKKMPGYQVCSKNKAIGRELCHRVLATKWQTTNFSPDADTLPHFFVRKKECIFVKTFFKMTVQEVVSKQAILKAIASMPEQIPVDALIDEIMYLYKIEIGLAQSQAGKVISLEDFKQKMKTWEKEK
jgi:hypothetical protein